MQEKGRNGLNCGETGCMLVPIIIPAYEPNAAFVDFIDRISEISERIVIVDDGSSEACKDIFSELMGRKHVKVLRHAVNLGKGRSLKDAFNYVLDQYPDMIGVVTADADGQHLEEDIQKILDMLCERPDHLILGCRDFSRKNIPWKSKLGNTLTRTICTFLCGVDVSDTQTGLRGIPADFLKILLQTPGERYEYETNMLLECNKGIHISEVPIHTIYESTKNHKTHFNPLKDSMMIYKVILSYSFSSILATMIDFAIFTFLIGRKYHVWFSTAAARIMAAFCNFILNKNIVFHSKENGKRQFAKYVVLVLISGTFSAMAVEFLKN